MATRYTLRTLSSPRNLYHYRRIENLYADLPRGSKVAAPTSRGGDRPVYFEGCKPFAIIECPRR